MLLRDDIHAPLYELMTEGNLQRQFDLLRDLVAIIIKVPAFKIDIDIVRWLHHQVTIGIVENPGGYRDHDVRIGKSDHNPPAFSNVSRLMGDFIVELHQRWDNDNEFTLAAFALWRICWIHPYEDGNRRTARAVAFLIICLKLGGWLPGRHTILEKIKLNGEDYKAALQHADETELNGKVDLIPLARLLSRQTVEQLSD